LPRKKVNKPALHYWRDLHQQRLPSAAGWVKTLCADISARAAAATSLSQQDSPRDKIFALLMARFDVLQAERVGMGFLLAQLRRQPALAAQVARMVAPHLQHCATQAGLAGALYTPALMLVYALALRVWANDASADMASTMRAVDKNLTYMFMLAELLPQRR
jgi:hypothetical protein